MICFYDFMRCGCCRSFSADASAANYNDIIAGGILLAAQNLLCLFGLRRFLPGLSRLLPDGFA